MTVVRTDNAMSSGVQTPMPAITRSKNTKTPGRASVTPERSRAKCAVGVEPTLTTGHGRPAARRAEAAVTTVERSRSGNGAHAWFFFAAPIPATVARNMGCYLITQTMARRHQLGMES